MQEASENGTSPRVSCWLFIHPGDSPGLATLCRLDQLRSCWWGSGEGTGGHRRAPAQVQGGAERPAPLQNQVREGQYGPGMAELEQQIAEHNILQKEIDAYGQQLRSLVGPVGEPPACTSQPQPRFSRQSLSWAGRPLGRGMARKGPVGPGQPTLQPASHQACVFSHLVETGCSHHPGPIPGPTGEQELGPGRRLGGLGVRRAWPRTLLMVLVFLGAA